MPEPSVITPLDTLVTDVPNSFSATSSFNCLSCDTLTASVASPPAATLVMRRVTTLLPDPPPTDTTLKPAVGTVSVTKYDAVVELVDAMLFAPSATLLAPAVVLAPSAVPEAPVTSAL